MDTLEGFQDEGKEKELSEVRLNIETEVMMKRNVKVQRGEGQISGRCGKREVTGR